VTGPGIEETVAPDAGERVLWTFLTNHFHVLACIYRDPGIRLRDVAAMVGITERAAQSMVADLAHAGYVTRRRVGRRNHYEVHPNAPLRHALDADLTVGTLLDALIPPRSARSTLSVAELV
jgi:hypothetical protein